MPYSRNNITIVTENLVYSNCLLGMMSVEASTVKIDIYYRTRKVPSQSKSCVSPEVVTISARSISTIYRPMSCTLLLVLLYLHI
jgi:hypothetical protein